MRKTPKMIVFAIAFLALSSAQVFAATFFVDNGGPGNCTQPAGSVGPFATIQAAENASVAGDTILVCPGTYNESVTLSKANQVVQGISDDIGSRISITGAGTADTAIVTISASNVLFQNFIIDGAGQNSAAATDFSGIVVTSGAAATAITGVVVQNNTVLNMTTSIDPAAPVGNGIEVRRGTAATAASVQILNNTILNYQRNGIWLNNSGTTTAGVNATVQGNYAGGVGSSTRGDGQTGIRLSNSASGGVRGDINNNRISENQRSLGCFTIDDCGQGIAATATSTPLTIRNNNISKIDVGVFAVDMSSSTVTRNQIFNSIFSIWLNGSTVATGSNLNDVSFNRLFSSNSAIVIHQASTSNSVSINVIEDAAIGVLNQGVNTSISGNTHFGVGDHVNP